MASLLIRNRFGRRVMHRSTLVAAVLAAATLGAAALAAPARAQDTGWPRQFDSSSGTFVIYQPQWEDLNGDQLSGRAAFSLKKSENAYPIFGVIWFTETISVDRDSSTVTARNFDVTKVRLPKITPDQATTYEHLVEGQAILWDLSGTVEELQAGLSATERERASVADLDNAPPKILFHDRLAILVVYDGTPDVEPIENSDLMRVVNTPYAVVFDPRDHAYYLNGANLWYRAKDPLGPWVGTDRPPAAVRAIVPPDTSAYDLAAGGRPEVLTATEPTELISMDGPPQYAPLVDDELLYVTNTESDVIREVSTQQVYVLLSGRWYRAPSLDGPWTFVRGDELPDTFKEIPGDSPKGHLLASVAGTDQAEDAVADAEIPQTSAIQRDASGFSVTYDGDPQFEPIEGTDLEYAVNTDAEVILADGRYYACDQGVWYIADSPDGPWSVSDTRPIGLDEIPPSCPVYDVRYVYVYDATPDVVYVGYTPGYLGCYPYYGTVVYGTGYRYRAWRSRHHYYPRRFTWGFGARYNPWLSRWSFGFTFSTGFLRVGTRWNPQHPARFRREHSMWFGPGGYHRPLMADDHRTFLRSYRSRRVAARVTDRLPWNVYSRPENVARVNRVIARTPVRSIARALPRPGTPNNVFAGKDGRVYRRDDKGQWQVRQGTKWTPTKLPAPSPRTTPSPGGRLGTTRPSTRNETPRGTTSPGRPSTERPSTRRENPPTPPSPRASQPPRERPQAPAERPSRPSQQPSQRPSARPSPPPSQSSPGDLEREYRARQRSESQGSRNNPPPSARPSPPRQQPRNEKAQESRPSQRENRPSQNKEPKQDQGSRKDQGSRRGR